MPLPCIQAGDTRMILPISKMTVRATQNNIVTHMQFELAFRNESGVPLPICLFPAPKSRCEIRNISVSVNGIGIGLVEDSQLNASLTRSNSIETALLARDTETVNRSEILPNGHTALLTFECVLHSQAEFADTFKTSIRLETESAGKRVDMINFFTEDIIVSGTFQVVQSSPVSDVRCNCGGSYHPLSSVSGEVSISSVPEESLLEFIVVMQSKQIDITRSRPLSVENFRVFSFAPLTSREVIEKLREAQSEFDKREKLCLLAQAVHGFQLNNEQIIKQELQRFPKYDGDVLGMPQNVGTELVSTVQPASWLEDDYESVYSMYEGEFVHNFVNMWDGRSQKRQLIHAFLTSIPAIIGLVMVVLSAILWGSVRVKGIGGLFILSVLFYVGSSLYVHFGRGSPAARRVNTRLVRAMKSVMSDLRANLVPGLVDVQSTSTKTAGLLWKRLFYEPSFELVAGFVPEIARNPEHTILHQPRVFRSLLLVNRYLVPMVFAFGEPEKVNQMRTMIRSWRNVFANALIQGCEEIKESVEEMIIDALLPEEVRFTRPMNLRHFTMDVPEIITLYKSVASTIAGRSGERGDELRQAFANLNRAIEEADANGTIENLKQVCNISPLALYFR